MKIQILCSILLVAVACVYGSVFEDDFGPVCGPDFYPNGLGRCESCDTCGILNHPPAGCSQCGKPSTTPEIKVTEYSTTSSNAVHTQNNSPEGAGTSPWIIGVVSVAIAVVLIAAAVVGVLCILLRRKKSNARDCENNANTGGHLNLDENAPQQTCVIYNQEKNISNEVLVDTGGYHDDVANHHGLQNVTEGAEDRSIRNGTSTPVTESPTGNVGPSQRVMSPVMPEPFGLEQEHGSDN
ncbi:uncharacterized protein LOC102810107 [Saccoglossus kowalevskii]|uniref:Uncharacterized protein LOC102810107 n=1 Tax=Saccoglossus kowalevskii TaxID=10224 RepID=A0ABM0MMA7_SACKO|nr:PREDICTED: uncharacterized protein LOC102810107 [Saccoglossus kowalevskii]